MKITPVASPGQVQDLSTPEHIRTSKAVEAFNKASSAPRGDSPVLNQNAVSVEEIGAIQTSRQNRTNESVEELSTESAAEDTQVTEAQEVKPQVDPSLSRQFAQLARQEKQLRAKQQAQEQAYKAREDALKAREAQLTAKDQEYQTGYISHDRLKQDTLTALAEANISYDEITQQLLNQQPKDPRVEATISRQEARIKALEAKLEQAAMSQTEQQQAQYQAAVKQIETDARHLVSNDPEFETIKATGSVKQVVRLIEQTYAEDGTLMSIEEAAKLVEEELINRALRYTKLDKIQKRMQSASTPKAQAPVQKQTQSTGTPANKQPQQMKTLTNAQGSSRQLSARERALLAFKGELKP